MGPPGFLSIFRRGWSPSPPSPMWKLNCLFKDTFWSTLTRFPESSVFTIVCSHLLCWKFSLRILLLCYGLFNYLSPDMEGYLCKVTLFCCHRFCDNPHLSSLPIPFSQSLWPLRLQSSTSTSAISEREQFHADFSLALTLAKLQSADPGGGHQQNPNLSYWFASLVSQAASQQSYCSVKWLRIFMHTDIICYTLYIPFRT